MGRAQRKYTLDEIDRMRRTIKCKCLFDRWAHEMPTETCFIQSRTYNGSELIVEIEEKLRTYMMAGADPDEMDGRNDRQEMGFGWGPVTDVGR